MSKMTGTIELSDQDIQDLYKVINIMTAFWECQKAQPDIAERLESLKKRLLAVEVNEH